MTKLRGSSLLLVGALLMGSVGAFEYRVSAADEWDEVFDTARDVLAHLPDADRIAGIADPSVRDAVKRAYAELKACAKINKNQSRAIKQASVSKFELAFKDVESAAAKSSYADCATVCRSASADCEKQCEGSRRKLCSCKMTQFGCFATKCLFN